MKILIFLLISVSCSCQSLDFLSPRTSFNKVNGNENILAQFAFKNGTFSDISSSNNRAVKNLFGVNPNTASHLITYPIGAGGQNIAFSTSTPFTIFVRFKSSSSGSENVIISNLNWTASYKGIYLGHNASGSLSLQLWTGLSTKALLTNASTFTDTDGNTITTGTRTTLNNGAWHTIAITYTGTFGTSNIRVYVDKGLMSTAATTSPNGDGDIVSAAPWKLGGRPNANTEINNMDFAEVLFYNVAKTHSELINIEDGYLDQVGLQRFYRHEEESGATIYNHYVTDYANPYNGVISGATPNNLRKSIAAASTRSYANKYGYSVLGSDIVPVNLFDNTKTVLNATPTYTGKVQYQITVNSLYPLSFLPNPNGYDELNNVGLTNSTTITQSGNTFMNSEWTNPLFRNREGTNYIVTYRTLRHFSDALGTDEIGGIISSLGIKTIILNEHGQSNCTGTNSTANGGDFINQNYKTQLTKCYIANNSDGTSDQVVTTFNQFTTARARGAQMGPDISLMGDLNSAKRTVYMYKYAIGSTNMWGQVNGAVNFWHPTYIASGSTGTRLFTKMIPGCIQAINFLKSQGRDNIEVIVMWDQGEANTGGISPDGQNYQAALEDFVRELKLQIPNYKGKFILRRVNGVYAPAAALRGYQDGFAAADPLNRVSYNSDDCGTWDTGNIHLTIPGQELSGQRAAANILSKKWLD